MPIVRTRPRIVQLLALACLPAFCVPTSASASKGSGDAAATRAYLHASLVYARAVSANVGASIAAIEAQADRIAGACPGVLTFAPRDVAFEGLAEEVDATVSYSGAVPVRSAMLRFSREIGRLTWSDRRLTRLVHSQAVEEGTVATLTLPDVCTDIATWKASAYSVLPAGAMSFLKRVEMIESLSSVGRSEQPREKILTHDLRRYEEPGVRRLVKQRERLEALQGKRFGSAFEAVRAKLAGALGVSTL